MERPSLAQPLANAKTIFSPMSNTIVQILSANVASSWHVFWQRFDPFGMVYELNKQSLDDE